MIQNQILRWNGKLIQIFGHILFSGIQSLGQKKSSPMAKSPRKGSSVS